MKAFLPQTLLHWLICLLVIVVTIGGGNFFWNARLFLQQGQGAAQNIKNSTARADTYLDRQLGLLESDAYQKSLKASLDTGAVYNATGRMINTQIVPRVSRDLDKLDGLLAALTGNSTNLSAFINDTNRSVNESLLPQAAALLASLTSDADRFGMSLDTFNTTLKIIADKAGLTLDEVYQLVASPEWKQSIANIEEGTRFTASTARHVDASAAAIEEAMKRAPSIAESLEKIAKTSSRYTKATLIANIIGVLAKAFLP